MKKQFDIKKLVLLNLPYLLMGLFATNFGEAWRLAQGANASEKFLSLFAVGCHRGVTASLLLQLLFLAVGKVLADGGFEQPAGELCSADNQR